MIDYTKLSPNHSGLRTHAIDRITPHCVVGQLSVEALGNTFLPKVRQASCNYAIGSDGRVAMIVEEKNRSWCSSSRENDQRAVTIECASDSHPPYAFNAVVYQKLIDLCVDICRRYEKKKLLWLEDKARTLSYNPAPDEMVLTVHRWFANKSCPGDWLFSRMGELATKVTDQLSGRLPTTRYYRVRKSWSQPETQIGAFTLLPNAKECAEKHEGYGIFDDEGKLVSYAASMTKTRPHSS